MAYVINIPNWDEDPVSNQTHPTLGVDISDYSAWPPLDLSSALQHGSFSLIPDEIGQETLADAHAGGPVVHQSKLSLKSEAKKNEQITHKLLPYNVWCTLTIRGGLMSCCHT
jgi:hypothetical protein